MTAIPGPILDALDRLNGHARAWGCGKKSVYAHKTLAALVLAHAGELTARLVEAEARCISCGGSGVWIDDWIDHNGSRVPHHSPCRKCRRTGKVTLQFVETRHGERVWHHPLSDGGREILWAAWRIKDWNWTDDIFVLEDGTERPRVFEPAGEWAPMRPGEKLIGDAAAGLLNIVEDWGARVEPSAIGSSWPREKAIREAGGYSLDIGRTENDLCCICSAGIDHVYDLIEYPHNLGFLRYRLHWSERVCLDCADRKHPEKPPPAEFIGPEIQRWLERRGIDLSQPWRPEPVRYWEE